MTAAAVESQTADAVLMVRPAHFAGNDETAASNFFQHAVAGIADAAERAQREFDALALVLADAGVRVHQFAGQRGAFLPDEIFPNNWLSLHADGTAVLYPLLAANRRRERRADILSSLVDSCGYRLERVVDLTSLEARNEYLEGTGSLVLDRARRVAYACRSPRTHENALAEFARALRYEIVSFAAVDAAGRAIYHTNVLLSLGTRFAALCTSAIPDARERHGVIEQLESSGRVVVDLRAQELASFAGNLLELRGRGGSVIALSAAALGSLAAPTRRTLERYGQVVAADIATIERLGGGSVRCMLAEVALPRIS
ncbi:MAG TPA: arginine deiminase-related protein [Gammaproteobacteria bacterium]|nr:arginine deiminase-related protein [Gammaproteobacteria bacterium]